MRGSPDRPLLVLALVLLLLPLGAGAGAGFGPAAQPRVVLVNVPDADCTHPHDLYCAPFRRATRRTGVTGKIVTITPREDPEDTLELIATAGHELVIVGAFYGAELGAVAPRVPKARFAIVDWPRADVPGRPRNVEGVVFRASEAAYLAGWLAGRLERERPGADVLGVVAGLEAPPIQDFVIGFRAGARRASPGVRLLVGYSGDFLDPSKCQAIARRQIARGAGAVFAVAGGCGLGALAAAEERGVWGIGVDTDQSSLGPHILTSAVKRYDVLFLTLLRQVQRGRIPTGTDTILGLRGGGVGLGKLSPRVPAALRAELDRMRQRVVSGRIRVPGAVPRPG